MREPMTFCSFSAATLYLLLNGITIPSFAFMELAVLSLQNPMLGSSCVSDMDYIWGKHSCQEENQLLVDNCQLDVN
jgi:hypothetical protein